MSDGSIRGLAAVRGRHGPGDGGQGGTVSGGAGAPWERAHPPTTLLLGLNDEH